MQRLVEELPSCALSLAANASAVKQLGALQSAAHVQWLLCGLGGEATEAAGSASGGATRTATSAAAPRPPVAAVAGAASSRNADAASVTGGGGVLKTRKYSEWMHVHREVRSKRNSAGKPGFTG